MFGTWTQSTAQGYLIFELTRSPANLGFVTFANGVPSWLFMLYAGIIADRRSPRAVVIGAQTLMMVSAFVLAALTFTGVVRPWHIMITAFLTGIGNAFDAPARQAMVPRLVDKDVITNAVALNSTLFNTAAIVGPALGGILYAIAGPGWCFLLNGLSFFAVIGALMAMRGVKAGRKPKRRVTVELREGFAYIGRQPLVRTLIFFIAWVSLAGLSYATLFPAWGVDVLHGDSRVVGYLQSARGMGALLGGVLVALMGNVRRRGIRLIAGAVVFPIAMWIFAGTTTLAGSILSLILVGGSSMLMMNLAMAMMQTTVDDDVRGRVMSVYTLAFFGMMPFGGLLAGWLAELLNAEYAIRILAVLFVVAAGTLFVRHRREMMSA